MDVNFWPSMFGIQAERKRKEKLTKGKVTKGNQILTGKGKWANRKLCHIRTMSY